MKGIVLAGGMGTRMGPVTKVTNKHLVPIYNLPMIYYPLQTLVRAGIDDIMLVTGGNNAGQFLELLGSGKGLGIKSLNYTYQGEPSGIAGALKLARDFADEENICVVLGDNITDANIKANATYFKGGGLVFVKEVPDPERFGIAEISGREVVSIEEKPKKPKTNLAVIGIYMYDSSVWGVLETLKPSGRGELEITDVNNHYASEGKLGWSVLNGWWMDAGQPDALVEASVYMKEK